MNSIQLIGAVETGLIYSLVAIGIYLSFRTLDFPDLTVDGSFPLGAAVCAAMIIAGYHPYVATLTATAAGACAGLVTAWLSTHLKMLNILAGILTSTALYSLNIRIMGRPNVALLGEDTIFSIGLGDMPVWIPLAILTILVALLVYAFLNTQIGLAIRATGNNARMSRAQGINDRSMVLLGLAISNAAVAFAGSLFAQKAWVRGCYFGCWYNYSWPGVSYHWRVSLANTYCFTIHCCLHDWCYHLPDCYCPGFERR